MRLTMFTIMVGNYIIQKCITNHTPKKLKIKYGLHKQLGKKLLPMRNLFSDNAQEAETTRICLKKDTKYIKNIQISEIKYESIKTVKIIGTGKVGLLRKSLRYEIAKDIFSGVSLYLKEMIIRAKNVVRGVFILKQITTLFRSRYYSRTRILKQCGI